MRRSEVIKSLDRYSIRHSEITDPVTMFNAWSAESLNSIGDPDFALFLLGHAKDMIKLRQEEIVSEYCL